jgi:twitching motility protein PilT
LTVSPASDGRLAGQIDTARAEAIATVRSLDAGTQRARISAMANVADALLDLLVSQGADALILEQNKAPVLLRAGARQRLSMPGLAPEMLAEVLSDVTDEPGRSELASTGTVRSDYETEGGVKFNVQVERQGGLDRFTFKRHGVEPRPRAAAPVEAPRGPAPEARRSAAAVVAVAPDPTPIDTLVDVGPRDDVLDDLLQRARIENASDVLVSSGVNARLRVGGELLEVSGSAVQGLQLLAFLGAAWDERSQAALETTGSTDLAFVHLGTRYRVNVFKQTGGIAAAFRPIRTDAPTLVELGLPDDLYRLVEYRNGLVLMTGTTGSGKSTTLVALLERLNRTQPKHVITLEDPIEYTYGRGAAMIHQREVGVHVESFSAGLRAALREAPDVILVGEMRDRDTIAAALTAAETGHLVLSTLHCADAGMAIDRIIDVFPEHQQSQVRDQLSAVLRAVVTQFLLPSLQPPTRVAAYEKLLVNTAVATKIRERRGHQMRSEIQTGRAEGMVPLELTLARLVREHRISKATARAAAHDPQLLEDHLKGR